MNAIARASFLLLVALFLAQGCLGRAPTPTRYYSLSPVAEPRPAERPSASGQGPIIALRPVDIPAYLDRPYIVTSAGPNEYRLSNGNRWAEPFQDNVTRTLARNISVQTPSDRVRVFPDRWSGPPGYVVQVRINRFEGAANGEMTLDADWSVSCSNPAAILAERRSVYVEPLQNESCDAAASAMSRGLERLGKDISDVIRAQPPR